MKKKLFWVTTGLLIATAAVALEKNRRIDDAKDLGWTVSPNVCGGYFANETMPAGPLLPLNEAPVHISAQDSQLVYSGVSTISGHVQISQPGRLVTSDEASLTSQNGDYALAKLKGHVTIQEKDRVAHGETAILKLKEKWYQLSDALYRLVIGNHLNGWGSASEVTQPPSGITELKNITYSTCPPQSRAWELSAEKLELNRDTGRGVAHSALLKVGGLPVFYSPYLNFPIDNRRQTGFLYPKFSFGSTSGFGMGFPFYWNIASNQDDTVMPYFYKKRGFQFNNQYRFLTASADGEIDVSVLPNDTAFRDFQKTEPLSVPHNSPAINEGLNDLTHSNTTRTFLFTRDFFHINPDWSGQLDYTRVSDDYYHQDIGGVPMVAQNQLLQRGKIEYAGDDFNFLGNLQGFQTLHPINEAVVQNQYNMLPQLLFTSRLAPRANRWNLEWQAEGVEFTQARNPGMTVSPSGERLNLKGAVSFPWSNIAGFFTPKIGEQLTQYNLGDQPMGLSDEINRSIPFFDIDTGLYFERNTHFFSNDYTQTLEPRLFYLYVPYRNQQDIPLFDSSLQPFNFNQLFLTNRFSGSDRIGDANQVSLALTSRFLDDQTGLEKFSADIGIIKYLAARKVILCQQGIACQDLDYGMGSSSNDAWVSPIAGELDYHFNPIWSTTLNTAWDPNQHQTQNATWAFQYSPGINQVINVGYSYIRNGDFFTLPNQMPVKNSAFNLSQPIASFAWPLNDRWNAVGSFGYSLNREHPLTYFGGVQYDSCCWAVQMILARTFSGFNANAMAQYNTGVYVQLAFKGLSKIAANDPGSLLLNNIPGYHDTFGS